MLLFFGCVDHKFLNAQMYSVIIVELPQMCFLLSQESPYIIIMFLYFCCVDQNNSQPTNILQFKYSVIIVEFPQI